MLDAPKDSYPGFNDLYRSGAVSEVACIAYIRRKFADLLQSQGLAKAIRYALTRMAKLHPILDRGIWELDKNTAEPVMRPITLGCKNDLFVNSEGSRKAAAIAYTLIETAKMNGVCSQAWLT